MMWLDRLNVWMVCAIFALSPLAANASQNALFSATTGVVSGLQLTNNYNNALDSVNTCNSGASAPANQLSGVPSLGNCWLNSTSSPYPWQIYDGANWLAPFWVDGVNHYTDVKIGGGYTTAASNANVDLCSTANRPYAVLDITGTTTINSFGSTCNPGHVKILTFAASLTLTNSATLILPGGANITTAAGDQAALYPVSAGTWQVLVYTPANGQAVVNDLTGGLCSKLDTWSPAIPASNKYVYAYGQALSRSSYPAALAACTITQSVTATNGSPTLTGFSDTTQLAPGMAVEASFLPNGTVIGPSGCTSTTCTLNNNATTSTTGNATIFPYGNGCGFGSSCASPSTTFNVPDCRDVVMAGRGNMGGTARSDSYALSSTYFGASPNALGVFGGAPTTTIGQPSLPNLALTFAGSSQTVNLNQSGIPEGTTQFGGFSSGAGPYTIAAQGSVGTPTVTFTPGGNISVAGGGDSLNGNVTQAPISRSPPTQTINCMVRVLAQLAPASEQFAANDNLPERLAIAERRRLAA